MYNWNILDDMFSLRELFNRAFGQASGSYTQGNPTVNLYEDDEASQVVALVPGLTKENLELKFEKGVLTIASQSNGTSEKNETGRKIREECCRTTFRRSLRLTREIESEKISAKLENGVLTVTLPHRVPSAPKKIKVA